MPHSVSPGLSWCNRGWRLPWWCFFSDWGLCCKMLHLPPPLLHLYSTFLDKILTFPSPLWLERQPDGSHASMSTVMSTSNYLKGVWSVYGVFMWVEGSNYCLFSIPTPIFAVWFDHLRIHFGIGSNSHANVSRTSITPRMTTLGL